MLTEFSKIGYKIERKHDNERLYLERLQKKYFAIP